MKKVILSMLLMFVSAVAYSQGVIGKDHLAEER